MIITFLVLVIIALLGTNIYLYLMYKEANNKRRENKFFILDLSEQIVDLTGEVNTYKSKLGFNKRKLTKQSSKYSDDIKKLKSYIKKIENDSINLNKLLDKKENTFVKKIEELEKKLKASTSNESYHRVQSKEKTKLIKTLKEELLSFYEKTKK